LEIQVGVSARHIHLSEEHLQKLFGAGYQLTPERYLSIATQYISKERLTVRGPKGELSKVAIIGPARPKTQVEISKTDGFTIGINVPVRLSGDLEGSESVTLVGPAGELLISEGLIVAMRHIHMTVDDAEEFGFQHKDFAMVVVKGARSLVFDFVVVRVAAENTHTEIHLDTDEANTSNLRTGDGAELLHVNDKKLRLEQIINMFDERQLRILEQSVDEILVDEKKRLAMMEDILSNLRRK